LLSLKTERRTGEKCGQFTLSSKSLWIPACVGMTRLLLPHSLFFDAMP